MFTGLVTAVGTIVERAEVAVGTHFRIRGPWTDLVDGESVAINGACLTVRTHNAVASTFDVAAVSTTRERTVVDSWNVHTPVNLERALRLGDRLGGHLVQGHVDGVGVITHATTTADAWLYDVQLPETLLPLCVLHGSICVDGISLTVNALVGRGIQLSIIDFTHRHTTAYTWRPGTRVHIEVDMVAKHVARLAEPSVQALLAPALTS
jgi:riboflavin synthase